jgi:phosphatidylinositol glycan class F
MVGAWCGVIPIGLDWDRPWQVCASPSVSSIFNYFLQAWPLTPAYGAIFGHVFGSLAAFFVSSVYLLAQANIQATLELEMTAKEPKVPETKVAKAKGKKKVQ